MKYINGFDTLRFLAVSFVILDKYHWGPLFPAESFMGRLGEALIPDGRFGVNLFFVLSGFLITSILLQAKFKSEDSKLNVVKTFFLRRALRIFPIYYLVVFIYFFLNNDFVRNHIYYFAFYSSNFLQHKPGNPLLHTWSLAVEEQFYLIWPWLIIFINRKYLKYVFICSILAGLAFKYIEYYVIRGDGYLVFSCFDSFGLGGLYAYARLKEETSRKFERAFVIILPLMLFLAWRLNGLAGLPIFRIYHKFLESCVALGLIMFVLKNKNPYIDRYIMRNPFFNFIGKISYGLYLYHFILGPILNTYYTKLPGTQALTGTMAALVAFSFKCTVLIFVAWLSYKFIEQPIIRLKNRFSYSG